MALSDKKVLETASTYRNVSKQSGTRLTGTVAENKAVFDDYPELIRTMYNGLIDYLMATTVDASGASQIGAENISGLTGTDVQALLEALKTLTDTKAASTDVAATYETITNANALLSNVTYNGDTGTFTFTKQGGGTITIDTTIEDIPVTMKFFENPVGSGKYYLGIYDKDDTLISSVNVSSLFNPITVADTTTIDLTETTDSSTGVKTISASVKANSIGSNEIDSTYMTTINTAVSNAQTYASNASASATNAETYKTNAASSATAAATSETNALGYANSASASATTSTSKATEASGYATSANTSATTATNKATLSESWAVGGTGTRTGENTNNAKYWCEQAGQIAGGVFVTQVNGVSPGSTSGPVTIDADDIGTTGTTNQFTNATEKQNIADNTTARHTHSNKTLLDNYDQTNTDLTDAVSKKHEHSNKSVLDGIASSDITAWNAKATTASYTCSLTTTWTSHTGYVTQEVSGITGLLATDTPILDITTSTSGYETEQEDWGKVFKAEVTAAGTINFYASEATTTSLTVTIKVVR